MSKIILKFGADWCKPCQAIEQPLARLAEKHAIQLMDVDVQQHSDMAAAYDIHNLPTVVLVDDQKELARFTGTCSQGDMESKLGLI